MFFFWFRCLLSLTLFMTKLSVLMLFFNLLVGARGWRPLWSPQWGTVTFGHCFLFFLTFYSLFLLPCPALAPALPCFEFSVCCQGQRRKLHMERAVFFFPFVARDRRRKLHREHAVFFFPFAVRDRRRKLYRERAVFYGQCFFFLLLLGTGGGSYTRNLIYKFT